MAIDPYALLSDDEDKQADAAIRRAATPQALAQAKHADEQWRKRRAALPRRTPPRKPQRQQRQSGKTKAKEE